MSKLVEKLLAVHESLTERRLPHAFGGAIALAYCTREPRGTRDLDLNIFVEPLCAMEALSALPEDVRVEPTDIQAAATDGQRRLWWGDTPIDVFLNTLPLHGEMLESVLWVPLSGRDVPVVDGASLVVFKVLIDCTQDWADIEAVAECSPSDIVLAAAMLRELLSLDDPRHHRLGSLVRRSPLQKPLAGPRQPVN